MNNDEQECRCQDCKNQFTIANDLTDALNACLHRIGPVSLDVVQGALGSIVQMTFDRCDDIELRLKLLDSFCTILTSSVYHMSGIEQQDRTLQ